MTYSVYFDFWILCNIKPNKQIGNNETIISMLFLNYKLMNSNSIKIYNLYGLFFQRKMLHFTQVDF